MSSLRLVAASSLDPEDVYSFDARFYGPGKATFLRDHTDWWSGPESRLFILNGGKIAACCGLMPARLRIGGQDQEGGWLIDMLVAPEYRGQGLQRQLEEEWRRRCPLILAFPHAVSARIFAGHGWGLREDLSVRLAPLDLRRLAAVRRASGVAGRGIRLGAAVLSPLGVFWRRFLASYRPRDARRLENPTGEELAAWASPDPALSTAQRDPAYLDRRYLGAPYRDELRFYGCDDPQPVICVMRLASRDDVPEARILDFFGDFSGSGAVDVLRLAIRDAARAGAVQVTAMASLPEVSRALRRAGFLLRTTARFSWTSPNADLMATLGRSPQLWCLGDSDNDPQG